MNTYDENVSLSEIFNINPEDYADISVQTLSLSARVLNRLYRSKIFTVKELMQTNIAFLNRINGFGKDCLKKVISCCEKMAKSSGERSRLQLAKSLSSFANNKQDIAAGDFSFAEFYVLSKDQKRQLDELKNSYDILGKELVFNCIYYSEKIWPIMLAFKDFNLKIDRIEELEEIFERIPLFRKGNRAKYYIDTYSYDVFVRNELISCYSDADSKLDSILMSLPIEDSSKFSLAKKFLKWCTFDLQTEISCIFNKIYSSSRTRSVIEKRAGRQTLNEIGEHMNITRERVRQIESKAKRAFKRLESEIKLMPKIFADLNGKDVISLEDLKSFGGENTEALIFLLKNDESGIFTYDSLLEGFVFGDNDLSTKIQDYIDSLPDIIHKKEVEKIINSAYEEYSIGKEYAEKSFYDSYKITGDVYHRFRLSLSQIYEAVVKRYYADGIHVYDDEEIESFRRHVHDDYGDISLPENNRAISARIAGFCILAGRGIYIPKCEPLLSDELAAEIYSYITESESSILFIGNIFSVFEKKLEAEGVNNKYYLQGILHELFGDKLYFKRDYVSRDCEFTSIYSSIVSFVKASKYPVKKCELNEHFKGITNMMLLAAMNDSEILNYFGQYLHSSNLVIRESEKEYLSDRLEMLLSDEDAHHIKDIYAVLNAELPEVFSRNAVDAPYRAFSLLEYIFRRQYKFSRPYIALKNVEIGRPNERLREMLYSQDEFSVSDITEFARENHMQIQALIEYINSLNDRFLLADNDTLKLIEEIGLNDDIAAEIEDLIFEEITDTVPIRDLQCVSKFPHINVPWNEWLVYSAIIKWGKRLEVVLSSSQFRMSIPLIAPKGKMDIEKYKDIIPEPNRIKIDDLDDIDSLLADILSEELLGES